ncbi:CHAT domain-containing protein [Ideonella sp. DXS22W]|uniref:CHAT domain-containing protein n=1 Tax=Pseudaquabacterium inlustre TaxID=2984192 RepID=A0ABU9CN29_9BURK
MAQSTPRPPVKIVTPPGRHIEKPALPRGLAAGHRGAGPGEDDRFLPAGFVRAVQAIDLSPGARDVAAGQPQELAPAAGQVLAIELAEGVTVYTSPENLQRTLAQVAPELVLPDGSVALAGLEQHASASRGVGDAAAQLVARVTTLDVGQAGDAITQAAGDKLREWLGDKMAGKVADQLGITWWGTKALMWAIEDRHGRTHGLYRWIGGETQPSALFAPENDPRLAKETAKGAALVFIHGTASSVGGSFGELQSGSPDTWRALELQYGERIYGFEHRSLSESPIDNALQLARALPAGARLHLVSHSRGGMVADLMCLAAQGGADLDALLAGYAVDTVALGGVDDDADRERLSAELATAYERQRAALRELASLLQGRGFVIERYVRVACPARGTRLASGNFDVFLSGLLSLIGLVPGLAGNPWYTAFKRVVLEIAKNRTRPQRVPGIEAMLPGSPMARLLARLPAQDGTQMAVIAGDIEGGGLLKRLGVLFTDHMFFDGVDNDLVVDTDSMSAGVARPATTRRLFDQGPEVNHFRYFTNPNTREALRRWLTEADPTALSQFSSLPALVPERSAEETRRRDIARAAQRGLTTTNLPVVIVLPGVMGTHLWVNRKDRVWMDPLDLLAGGLEKVKYGQPNVEAEKLFDMSYGDLCEHLAASHQVERFPYDWRLPLDQLADTLAARVRAVLDASANPARPVRVVAHSMGGLVTRAMIVKHPALWTELMQRPGARFVMLGTPNHGSHQMVEMLIGKGDTVRMLAHASLKHSLQQVLDLVGGFRGPLALLPRPGFIDEAAQLGGAGQQLPDYFRTDVWDTFRREIKDLWFGTGVVAQLSKQALDEGGWLWRQGPAATSLPTGFEDRTFYVHGVASSTACGIVKRNGRWQMLATPHGDGTVSWPSGKLGGIGQYYYMPASHGALADTAEYFEAIASLISTGQSGNLLTSPPRARDTTGAEITQPVAYDAGPPLVPNQEELAASLMRREAKRNTHARGQRKLYVRICNDDLRALNRPILVGHYERDAISGAEALIDRDYIPGELRKRYDLGLYAGPIGSATVVLPVKRTASSTYRSLKGVVVAGLGPFDGSLGAPALTTAVRSAVTRLLLYVLDAGLTEPEDEHDAGLPLASLLIGNDTAAGLGIGDVLAALIKGTDEANHSFREATSSKWHVDSLDIVEVYRDTAFSAALHLDKLQKARAYDRSLRCGLVVLPIKEGNGARERLLDTRGVSHWWRLLVSSTSDDGIVESAPANYGDDSREQVSSPREHGMRRAVANRLRFIYLGSRRARVEAQIQQRQPGLVERLTEKQLRQSEVDKAFGRSLFQLLIPNELKDAVRQLDRTVLVLDGATANLPWEMMRIDDVPLAYRTRLVRQLATLQFSTQVHQASGQLALVIGNPSYEGFGAAFTRAGSAPWRDPDSLPEAENEAQTVVDVLQRAMWKPTALIGQNRRSLEVITALIDSPWRLLHIAAHGVVDLPHPDGGTRSGVVLSDGLLITAAEISAMQAVPELVFLNCCHLGQIDLSGDVPHQANRNRLAASLARELIQAGVRSVVVAGWAVDDAAAQLFATTFYERLLIGRSSFGDAVFEARRKTYERFRDSTTWGAYQAYGEPDWRFASDTASDSEETGSNCLATEEFVSPRQLVEELQLRRRDVMRQHQALTPSVVENTAQWLNERLRAHIEWSAHSEVAVAAAQLFSDLGPRYFGEAITLFWRALDDPRQVGHIDIDAVQQLANLEARHGEATDDLALLDRAITRVTDVLSLLAGAPAVAKAGSSGLTPERASLLGSAYKRRAVVLARAGRLAQMRQDLQASLGWYRAATAHEEAPERHPYSVLNWLTLAAWDTSLAPHVDATARLELAQRCGDSANASFRASREFWDAVMVADAQLTMALLRGELAATTSNAAVARLYSKYVNDLDGVMMPLRGLDSVAQQLHMTAQFFAARGRQGGAGAAADLRTAQSLHDLGERLMPGSTRQVPQDAPPDAAQPAKPARKAAPAKKAAPARKTPARQPAAKATNAATKSTTTAVSQAPAKAAVKTAPAPAAPVEPSAKRARRKR